MPDQKTKQQQQQPKYYEKQVEKVSGHIFILFTKIFVHFYLSDCISKNDVPLSSLMRLLDRSSR